MTRRPCDTCKKVKPFADHGPTTCPACKRAEYFRTRGPVHTCWGGGGSDTCKACNGVTR
jgi:hypothetical protein